MTGNRRVTPRPFYGHMPLSAKAVSIIFAACSPFASGTNTGAYCSARETASESSRSTITRTAQVSLCLLPRSARSLPRNKCLVLSIQMANGLAGLVRFGSVPEPFTLVAGIQSLPAGHRLRVQSGRIINSEAFWHPGSSVYGRGRRSRNDDAEAIQSLRGHLERSVSQHLLSDVPVATFLSGGVDSSVITAVAARASSRPIHTITLGFHDREFDESAFAAAVSRRYGTTQHRILLSDEEVIELIPEAVRRFDLPSLDGVNTYIVSRAAVKSNIKVVLSGLGGDELFGGYRSFRMLKWAQRLAPFIRWSAPLASRALSKADGSYQRGFEMVSSRDLSCSYASLRSLWSRAEIRQMGLNPSNQSNGIEPDWSLLTQISWLELAGYMRSTLLRDSDAMSMAQSIELRVPFLDYRLVEWCLEAGAADYSRGSGRKLLLLRAAADLIPPEIGRRRKQGFALPMDRWMRGPLSSFVARGLSAIAQSGLLPAVDFPRLQREFQAGALPWARVWEFTVLGHWVEQHLA
jgi:asparagine synthase (glutamine-hydrolysing)